MSIYFFVFLNFFYCYHVIMLLFLNTHDIIRID
nr:MAG TPA: hypothetical protein [Caudoviricetes sp.]